MTKIISYHGTKPDVLRSEPDCNKILDLMAKQMEVLRQMTMMVVLVAEGTKVREAGPPDSMLLCPYVLGGSHNWVGEGAATKCAFCGTSAGVAD